jgi:YggT family protein
MGYLILTINVLFAVYYVLLVLRAVLPWLPHDRQQPLVRPVYLLTDPLLRPLRLGLPPEKIGFDVSPFAGIILLWLVQGFIIHFILGG